MVPVAEHALVGPLTWVACRCPAPAGAAAAVEVPAVLLLVALIVDLFHVVALERVVEGSPEFGRPVVIAAALILPLVAVAGARERCSLEFENVRIRE